tara:strand:+ start:1253 stop:1576 length:324 start_codon:yes stop_codon:yes gene_type:complete
MADNVTIIVQPVGQISITASDGVAASTSADLIPYDNTGTDIAAENVGAALDELAGEQVAQASAPTSGVSEGDVWYDTDDDKYYVRKNSSWVEILDSQSSINIDGGTY